MNANKIRKELAILIKAKQKECTNEKQKNHAVNQARMEINLKYGNTWRWEGMSASSPSKSYRNPQHIGTDIPDGDEWSDYAQTADDF